MSMVETRHLTTLKLASANGGKLLTSTLPNDEWPYEFSRFLESSGLPQATSEATSSQSEPPLEHMILDNTEGAGAQTTRGLNAGPTRTWSSMKKVTTMASANAKASTNEMSVRPIWIGLGTLECFKAELPGSAVAVPRFIEGNEALVAAVLEVAITGFPETQVIVC